PAVLAEECEPVLRIELKGRVAHEPCAHFLAEANGLWREIVRDPEADLLDLSQIVSKISDVLVGQIGDHTLGENEELVRAGADIGEELPPESRFGEVEADALEPAARLLACEPRLFQLDHAGNRPRSSGASSAGRCGRAAYRVRRRD